ncbi:hypothetical protein [Methanopyrus kandleri]|uniref:Uncharacterized protein n=2 Tax=Methanopyrus kandleri TaxID=2320 RepID=Q8TWE0_METKA|nr:hypothetical protein [Methanopyrus kandleri]AAM02308.1 Uncharacterized protein MK1095 [Methanopyrus kandleri AV19]HII69729.1 hypothetical protein [Methanopyrus kandleri]
MEFSYAAMVAVLAAARGFAPVFVEHLPCESCRGKNCEIIRSSRCLMVATTELLCDVNVGAHVFFSDDLLVYRGVGDPESGISIHDVHDAGPDAARRILDRAGDALNRGLMFIATWDARHGPPEEFERHAPEALNLDVTGLTLPIPRIDTGLHPTDFRVVSAAEVRPEDVADFSDLDLIVDGRRYVVDPVLTAVAEVLGERAVEGLGAIRLEAPQGETLEWWMDSVKRYWKQLRVRSALRNGPSELAAAFWISILEVGTRLASDGWSVDRDTVEDAMRKSARMTEALVPKAIRSLLLGQLAVLVEGL